MSRLFQFVLIIVCHLNPSVYAQENEFGEVSIAELSEQFHPLDSSASAAVLYKTGKLNIKDGTGFEVKKRIKIYNDQGYKYATIKLPYNSKNSAIIKLKAWTYNLIGNKIQKIKLSNNQIIEEETTKNYEQIKFTFPNLKNGSIIEYSYTRKIFELYSLPEWKFQEDIPVNFSNFTLITPKFIKYNEITKGFHFVDRKDESNIRYDKYIYTSKNLPKLKESPFVNNIDNYRTSIRHEISSVSNNLNNKSWGISNNWNELSKRLEENRNFGKELNKERYFKEDIKQIINNSNSGEEIIENIFNYIKEKLTWNERFSIYTSDKLKNIYKENKGNSADINLMLTAMLRYAEFQAHPVLVSTVDNGIPSRSVSLVDYNNIISAVEISKEKTILLDATNKFSTTSILPTRCLNWHGRLVRPNGSNRLINLNPTLASDFYAIMNIKLNDNGKIDGQIRRVYSNHFAYDYRNKFDAVDKDKHVNTLENQLNINISEFKVDNIDNLKKSVIETFSFRKDNAVDLINGNMYISPLLFLAIPKNPFNFDQKERIYPIDFTYPKTKRYIINIEVPEDYMIEYAIDELALNLVDNSGSYRFNINQNSGTNLQIMVEQNINQSVLGPEYYKPLKEFYSSIVNKENDKIVLIKKP